MNPIRVWKSRLNADRYAKRYLPCSFRLFRQMEHESGLYGYSIFMVDEENPRWFRDAQHDWETENGEMYSESNN